MASRELSSEGWQTKSSDRFVLKWIKCNLSARITPGLLAFSWMRPWIITVGSMALGIAAGCSFAAGWGVLAGLLAGVSQILDGVDGQYARLTGAESSAGAFLDSALDRYSDGFLVLGLIVFNVHNEFPGSLLFILGALAFTGSGLVSYTSARAESLGIDLGNPTLASKGTRTTVIAIAGILSCFLTYMPMVALCYLVLHTNLVVVWRIRMATRSVAPKRSLP
ncbi:MAG: CDP-alcohol phosphatidyltransferase family protein [Deltaproteobacteria bacterium]|nr:CDP-alcohol phosphatidyltransferase family protein [Deltaproteobacteria bacterium]